MCKRAFPNNLQHARCVMVSGTVPLALSFSYDVHRMTDVVPGAAGPDQSLRVGEAEADRPASQGMLLLSKTCIHMRQCVRSKPVPGKI